MTEPKNSLLKKPSDKPLAKLAPKTAAKPKAKAVVKRVDEVTLIEHVETAEGEKEIGITIGGFAMPPVENPGWTPDPKGQQIPNPFHVEMGCREMYDKLILKGASNAKTVSELGCTRDHIQTMMRYGLDVKSTQVSRNGSIVEAYYKP